MKTFLTLSLHLLISTFLFAQAPQGIPYQAVIRDNVGAPLVNASVTVRFTLHQNTIDGPVEYQETQSLSTNAFGVINTQFGMGMATQGSFENIIWSNTTKFIQVEANDGSGYLDMGTQQMMSVPYAMYSSKSENSTHADNGFSNVSQTGDTLYMSNGTFIIVPGISTANFPPAILGCTSAQACNYSAAATQDDGSCLYQNATCDDGNANTTNDVIGANCQCAGTATGNGFFVPGNGVTDIDGTVYTSIVINGQEWMQQNLAVTKYRNGDPIPTGLDDATWQNTTNGAYAIYNNDAANNTTYGKLYNWYTTVDTRGLCPTGWHMPSDADWTTLINYLDPSQNPSVFGTQSSVAGGKMKSTIVWNSPNTGATNESGFTGLPGGYRLSNGTDYYIGNYGTWWSSTENDSGNAWNRKLYYLDSSVRRDNNYKQDGFSVRCVKDTAVPVLQGCTDGSACNFMADATQDDGSCLYQNATCDDGNANTTNDVINANCECAGTSTSGSGTGAQLLPGNATCATQNISVTGCGGQTSLTYDGRTYDLVEIGGQCWFADNLATDQYRNGDPIPTGLDNNTWQNTTAGAYSIYNNDPENDLTYGKLYNWYTTVDIRGLCPTGWHVPTDCEWMYLEGSLGMTVAEQELVDQRGTNEGGALKATINWTSPNTGATNSSGFTALPGGIRGVYGTYFTIGNSGGWWSSTEDVSVGAFFRRLYYNYSDIFHSFNERQVGYSVRCVKDTTVPVLQGCTDGSACNFMADATQDDGSCLYQNATCDDGDANTTNDVINANCECAGTAINTGNIVIGQDYQGGKVAYIFQPGDAGYLAGETHGLIAAPQDLPGTYQWGCYETTINEADGLAIGTGAQNTMDIVNAGCGLAAQACADLEMNGYSDWFLPSLNELQQLYTNRAVIGGFVNYQYWSSSEISFDSAWAFVFTAGFTDNEPKNYSYLVRAVRAF